MAFILYIFSGFILFVIIYLAVRTAINDSVIGLHLKQKYGIDEKPKKVSDEEIEKELEKQFD